MYLIKLYVINIINIVFKYVKKNKYIYQKKILLMVRHLGSMIKTHIHTTADPRIFVLKVETRIGCVELLDTAYVVETKLVLLISSDACTVKF